MESKVDQRMEFYYEKKLKIKRDRLLRNITPIKKLSVLSIKAIIKTDGRAQNIPFMVDELDHPGPIGEEWQPINEQLIIIDSCLTSDAVLFLSPCRQIPCL